MRRAHITSGNVRVATAAARRSGADQIQQKWRRRRARRESKDRTRQNYKKRVRASERIWRPIRVDRFIAPCHFSLHGRRPVARPMQLWCLSFGYCIVFFALITIEYGWAVG